MRDSLAIRETLALGVALLFAVFLMQRCGL